ncbi:MAG: universal stress protein [Opitutaceae bacterium]|nr:universal stress protein [Opitutaceae bacterium]
MYQRILVALDHTPADESLLPHVQALARRFEAELILLHVADGWVARHFASSLQPAESEEMKSDRDYLETTAAGLAAAGLKVRAHLALGNPPAEILRAAEREQCDLIAMTTHGHRLLGDLFYGSTIETVRHRSHIPIFVVRAERR